MFQLSQRVQNGVRKGEPGRIGQPLAHKKPQLEDYPEPVWVIFDHLPAQFFPSGR